MKDYIAYFLIIFGWIIVHFCSSKRDKKKEWREFSRQTAVYLDKITDISIDYHTDESRDKKRESEIKDFLDDLEMKIILLQENLKFTKNISDFREAVTLENFETARFVQLEYDDKIIKNIITSSRELKKALYKA